MSADGGVELIIDSGAKTGTRIRAEGSMGENLATTPPISMSARREVEIEDNLGPRAGPKLGALLP